VTLGRGGSDLTATLLARSLGARSVVLWKDVPGMLTADPRVVPDARLIPELHVREAAELAYYGAKVLHPRALIGLGDATTLYIRPFADPAGRGTVISASPTRDADRHPVKAVAAVGEQAIVTITGNGMAGVPGTAARLFGALERAGISVSLISQASSEHSICIAVPNEAAAAADVALRAAFADQLASGEVEAIEVRADTASLAVVGLGMAGAHRDRGAALRRARGREGERDRDRAGRVGTQHLGGGGRARRRRGAARGARGLQPRQDRRRQRRSARPTPTW
jgi:aspartokinase/homoserine dehydrogenase 1